MCSDGDRGRGCACLFSELDASLETSCSLWRTPLVSYRGNESDEYICVPFTARRSLAEGSFSAMENRGEDEGSKQLNSCAEDEAT